MDNLAIGLNGQVMMGYVGETPWHNKGQVATLGQYATKDEMVRAAGLGWRVCLAPTEVIYASPVLDLYGHQILNPDGTPMTEEIRIPAKSKCVIREDNHKILSEGVSRFTPLQNEDLLGLVEIITGTGAAVFETAGALGDGETVWALARLGGEFTVGGKDPIERYLMFLNSHLAGRALKIFLTDVRVVCQNTLVKALNSAKAGSIQKIAHMPNLPAKVKVAEEALGFITQDFQHRQEVLEAATAVQMNDQTLEDMFTYVWPIKGGESQAAVARNYMAKQYRSLAAQLFETGVGHEMFPGTLYQANCAIQETANFQGRRDSDAQTLFKLTGDGAMAGARGFQFTEKMLKAGY